MASRAPGQQKLELPAASLRSGYESIFVDREQVEALSEPLFFSLSEYIEVDAEHTVIFRDCHAVRAAFGMPRGP